MRPGIDLVTVLYDSSAFIPMLAETVRSLAGLVENVILVDNASSDGSAELAAASLPDARVIRSGVNVGFGAGNNVGLAQVRSPLVLLMNPDATIDPASVENLRRLLLENPDVAGVQPCIRLLGWPCITTSMGVGLTRYGEGYDLRFHHCEPGPPQPGFEEVPAVTCACALFRMEALESVGLFDEGMFMYFEDVDLSLRLGLGGWRLLLDRDSVAAHHVGASGTPARTREWQLESSVLLTRRYLSRGASGRLPGYWWKRELRTIVSSILKGRDWSWRVRAVRRGATVPAFPRVLPERVRLLLDPDPMDAPLPRRPGGFPLDRDGAVTAGPGWVRGGGPVPCGFFEYGAIESAAPGGRSVPVVLDLVTEGGLMSGSLLTAEGTPLGRFVLGGRPVEIEIPSRPAPGRFVLRMDDPFAAGAGGRTRCLGAVSRPGDGAGGSDPGVQR